MPVILRIIKQYLHFIQKENFYKLLLIIIVVVLCGSFGFQYFEKNISFYDSIWWSFVTITTVGYGDIYPVTVGGRIVASIVMLIGIGLLGVFTAIIASVFVDNKIRESKGMKPSNASNHMIICGWNYKGHEIVAEMRADPKCKNLKIVILADIAENPVDDDNVNFYHGDINEATLQSVNIDNAHTIIILSDDKLDSYSRDAKTILNTMTIKSIKKDIYVCVELMDKNNIDHCKIAGANEIIVVGEISTNLLVQAAVNHGITRFVSELVSNRYGNDLYKIKIPSYIKNKSFLEAVCLLKEKENILCLGVADKYGKNLIANPDNNFILQDNSQLIVIALDRPVLK